MRIEVMQNSLIKYCELDDNDNSSNEEDELISLLEQEAESINDECESTSFVDGLLADMETSIEEHNPPDEE